MKQLSTINEKLILTTSQKVLFMAVIPEVLNRESILFKKLRAPGFSPRRVAEVTRLRGNDDFLRVHQYLFICSRRL